MDRSPAAPPPVSALAFAASGPLDRRRFALALAGSSAALLAGCRSPQKPARDATLLHNRAVREAVSDLEQTMNNIDEHMNQFNAENWQDALANLQTSVLRMHNSIDDLKRALGYRET